MFRRTVLGLALAACLSAPASAYPDRAVTLVTGFAPGGSTDVTARLVADRLGPALNTGPAQRASSPVTGSGGSRRTAIP
jgi:tripartite-type tricarboxylate transporter receptor subunit TctC